MMTLITSSDRKAGADDPNAQRCIKQCFPTVVDTALKAIRSSPQSMYPGTEAWNGTEQKRHYRFEGDKLLIDTARQPSVLYPGKMTVAQARWERDK